MRVASLVLMVLVLSLSGCIMTAGVSTPADPSTDPEVEQAYEWKGMTIGV